MGFSHQFIFEVGDRMDPDETGGRSCKTLFVTEPDNAGTNAYGTGSLPDGGLRSVLESRSMMHPRKRG